MIKFRYMLDPEEFEKWMEGYEEDIANAATSAFREIARKTKKAGRENIAAGGFGKRWQNALRVEAYPEKGSSLKAAIQMWHKIPYADIFETGGPIIGSPTLWIPISENMPSVQFSKDRRPRAFSNAGVKLFPLNRTGKHPVLAAKVRGSGPITMAKLRKGTEGGRGKIRTVPLFFGMSRVDMPKRFDLVGTWESGVSEFSDLYFKFLARR